MRTLSIFGELEPSSAARAASLALLPPRWSATLVFLLLLGLGPNSGPPRLWGRKKKRCVVCEWRISVTSPRLDYRTSTRFSCREHSARGGSMSGRAKSCAAAKVDLQKCNCEILRIYTACKYTLPHRLASKRPCT